MVVNANSGGKDSLFCYAVVMNPPEPTFELVEASLKRCDGYLFFSNFSDPSHRVKGIIHDEMKVQYGGLWGSALNTKHFYKVWKFMANDPEIAKFKWFAKIDLDTVLIPERLQALIAKNRDENPSFHDPSRSIAWGAPIPGPIELFSQGALLKFKERHEAICHVKLDIYNVWQQEDMYIYKCLEGLGYDNTEPPRPWRFDGHVPHPVLEMMEMGKDPVCYLDPGSREQRCLERAKMREYAAFHPFKTPEDMRKVQKWLLADSN